MIGNFHKIPAIGLICAGLIAAGYPLQGQDDNERLRAQVHTLKHANLTAPDGSVSHFSDFKGKLLLISMWASWCPNCISEFASFKRLQQMFGKDNVEIILVGIPDDWAKEQQFARSHQLDFPIYVFGPSTQAEIDAVFSRTNGSLSLPQTVIWDEQRWVKVTQTGAVDWTSSEVLPLMKKTLSCPGDNDKYPLDSPCRD